MNEIEREHTKMRKVLIALSGVYLLLSLFWLLKPFDANAALYGVLLFSGPPGFLSFVELGDSSPFHSLRDYLILFAGGTTVLAVLTFLIIKNTDWRRYFAIGGIVLVWLLSGIMSGAANI